MAESLVQQRCFNHAAREAVARCPECKRFFCRECITEHDDRVICAVCLRRIAGERTSQRSRFGVVLRGACLVLGVMVAWLFFYFIGQMLSKLPSSFHETTVWSQSIEGEE